MAKKEIEYKIVSQGGPIVESARAQYYPSHNSKVVLVTMDFRTKYCNICATGCGGDEGPSIFVECTKDSTNYKEKYKKRFTAIEFPTLKGYTVFSANCGKYSVFITFQRSSDWLNG